MRLFKNISDIWFLSLVQLFVTYSHKDYMDYIVHGILQARILE